MPASEQETRSYEDELSFLESVNSYEICIQKGFVDNMNVPGVLYVNQALRELLYEELKQFADAEGVGGFLPAVKQVANVAALPGVVGRSVGLPDIHSGYGFAIGNVAAMDMDLPESVVSPGGVGFDINCGVRLIRTNLTESDISSVKEDLVEELFQSIPVGVGAKGSIPMNLKELDKVLEFGLDWAVENGYAWKEDKLHCEEQGRMIQADPSAVSDRAKRRGISQIGTLGAGNHYAEIQVVDEIYDVNAAKQMGITQHGQVCIMIHSGSRGLGHQVATDALKEMEEMSGEEKIPVNDRQLACARIHSASGQKYLKAMAAAANYAWVNRSVMTHLTRKTFEKVLKQSAEDMEMHLVYDVCHNIAKVEEHVVDGQLKKLLVHRKGATRAFGPHHPLIPEAYQDIGQPVLVGGTMGTSSYILTGTNKGMEESFGSTCHGAGRAQSRSKARKKLDYQGVLDALSAKNISIRVATPHLVSEEAPEVYKDVSEVIETCHLAGISKKCVKLRPIAVIKG